MNKPAVVLMRASLAEEDELSAAKRYFPVVETRSRVPSGALVVGRYSVLPYYNELVEDLSTAGSELINSSAQHHYLADLREWYEDLQALTPRTFFSLADFKAHADYGCSYVLKGQTNSKKHQWNTHMFAASAADVSAVYMRLYDDGLIGDQSIYIREFVPLRTFGDGIRGLPISEEYRFFVLDGQVVGSGWYWSQFPEIRESFELSPALVDPAFLQQVLAAVGTKARFYVVDVARKANGHWMVVELNDGCMSGLSDVDPNELYANLRAALLKE